MDPINTLNKNWHPFEPVTHADGIADVKYFLTDMWRNLYSTSSLTPLTAIQVKGLEDNCKVKTSIKGVCYDRGKDRAEARLVGLSGHSLMASQGLTPRSKGGGDAIYIHGGKLSVEKDEAGSHARFTEPLPFTKECKLNF